ncbi:alpha/beta-hydrolase [Auriscalpium vulgare]|uniref:Alpha/beta-hydrolase n=1 Tax=Auriscalpium vulgare TaxID=40419 RepID=A0ACB8S5X8_9AGAM|nr:alpha/beta-hydrolase [Auriscalpium vulgare]
MLSSSLLACAALSLATTSLASIEALDPYAYTKRVAKCNAINRELNKNVDIDLHYVDINPEAKKAIVLVHGWPSLWHSWKYQIPELQDEYHLIVPDLRGFGSSTHPGDVHTSGTMPDQVGDLECLFQHANVEHAVCIGHDWGSAICYEAARSRPDLIEAVVGITVPYLPSSGPFMPTSALTKAFPKLTYQLYFDQETPAAVAELSQDVRRSLRATLRTANHPPPSEFLLNAHSFLDAWKEVGEVPPIPFFTKEEEDYWVEQYSIQKFAHTLYFYTTENRQATWAFVNGQGNHTIPQPVLSILPTQDSVANWVQVVKALGSEKYLPQLTTEVIHGSHWVHLEDPRTVNAAIQKFLHGLKAQAVPPRDEL